MSLQETLEDIDNQLEDMPKNNRTMLYAFVAIAIIGFLYYSFGISLQEEAQNKEDSLISLEAELAQKNPRLYKTKIAKEKKRILSLKAKYETEQYRALSLRSELEAMDYLSTDSRGMADMLQRILQESVRLNVNIERVTIDNAEGDYTKQIKKRGKIIIQASGGFHKALKLMRFIESQEALTTIDKLRFDLQEEANVNVPIFTITIMGYGIAL